jgi:IS605 OrfB family transposase
MNNKQTYIRSTKVSLNKANKIKLQKLLEVQSEYSKVVIEFIDILWINKEERMPSLLPKNITENVKTWLSARMIQCAGKQASAIVRGTIQKQKQRLFIYNKLVSEGKTKEANKLLKLINYNSCSKPTVNKVIPMELDERFIKITLNNNTTFDGWLTISSIGNKIKLKVPFKKTKHFNKLAVGKLMPGIRINQNYATFMFSFEHKEQNQKNNVIGIDVGIKNTISCSDGQQTGCDIHGHSLDTIQRKLAKKKKGSKAFLRVQNHRKNYINWSINQLNLKNVDIVKCEKIKNLRSKQKVSRYMSSWTYADIFDKLQRKCEEQNVSIVRVSPTYTSQRCFACGWVCKKNRKGKSFKCTKCEYAFDADLNAAKNISLNLREIGKKERLLQKNKTGFYWTVEGQEHIVPDTQKDRS